MADTSIKFTLAVDDAQFKTAIDAAQAKTAAMTGSMSRGFGTATAGAQGLGSQLVRLGAIAAASLSVGAIIAHQKAIIDSADAMNDLSQRVGISVKELAKYELASAQSGTTMEALAKGVKGLSGNMLEHGDALKKIGITATTADGAMRQFADIFAAMPDSMEKTNLAVKVFGKSGMDLIPMLNMGSQGLEDAAVKSAKYAAVMAQLAPQADAFNDTMSELGMYSKIAGMNLANDMLPALTEITKAMAEAAQKGGTLAGIVAGLDAFGNRMFDWNGNAQRKGIQNLESDLVHLQEVSAAITFDVFGRKGVIQAEIEEKTNALKAAQQAYFGFTDSAGAGRGSVNPANVKPTADQPSYKAIMAALGSDANGDADKALKAQDAFVSGLQKARDALLLGTQQAKLNEAAVLGITGAKLALVKVLLDEETAYKLAVKSSQDLADAHKKEADGIATFTASQTDAYNALVKGSVDALKAVQDEYDQYGLLKSQIAEITLLTLTSTQAKFNDGTEGYNAIQKQIDAQRVLIGVLKMGETRQAHEDISPAKTTLKDVAAYLDPAKAQSFGDALKSAFGDAGDALAKMGDSFGNYLQKNEEWAKKFKAVANDTSLAAEDRIKIETGLMTRQADIQISAYGDMAGAAKGFFKEGSDGYRLMQGVEQAAHLLQMANLAERLFTSLFVSTATATGVVAGQAVETTAVVAGETVRNAAKVPGVFMSFMSALGPWGAAAAGVAIAAVLGGTSSGKGAPSVSMDAFAGQAANSGTGTVLSDSSAQSESIQNSLSALESFAKPSLLFTSQMVGLLRSINTSLSGATSSLLSSGFDAFGNQFQGSSSKSGGGIIGSIFGSSSSSTSLSDLGLSFAKQSIADAMKAVSLQQYQVTRTDSSSSGFLGFGSSSSTSYNSSFSGVDGKVSQAMTQAVGQMFSLVEKAALQIGATQSQIDALKNIDTGLGKISLKDKTGQEIEALLTSVFSAMGDSMAAAIAPGLADMQKAGEGLLETFIRITNGLSITNTWARIFGRSLLDVSIQGATAANQLAEAFGGLSNLNDQSQAFYESYYSQAEQAANHQIAVSEALASVNLAMPTTKDNFRSLANSLDLTTESGRAAYAMLLSLAPEFSDTSDMLDELAQDMAKTLMETFTGRGQLIPALNAAALAMATVSTSAGLTTGALSSINSILGDSRSRVLYFGDAINNTNAPLNAAQLSTLALRNEMLDLSISASGTIINFAGLTQALQNVDTRTFVATVTSVFEVIGQRIRDVLSGIADERSSVRDAAINIIGAGGMTAAQISQQIRDAMVGLPGSGGVLSAQSALSAADARVAATAAAAAAAAGAYGNAVDRKNATGSAFGSQQDAASTAQANLSAGQANATALRSESNYITGLGYSSYNYRVQRDALAARASAAEASIAGLSAALSAAQAPLGGLNAAYNASITSTNTAAAASAAAAATAAQATAAQTTAATAAKNAQLAYIASLQQYAVDAGKAVKQLGALRQETVNYFNTQKQLADLMTSSASGLRQTVADYRFGLMDPRDQLAQLQERFNVAYSMALSTSGDVLAGYGNEINSLINPLLQKAQEAGLSGSEYAGLINTTLARADSVAARLDATAPANYQTESLTLLAQIDASLAALESGALTADQIVVNAIKAGSDTTANGLRAVIAAITGQSIPAFAAGGAYAGGMAMVGEAGPELINFNRPGQVYNASQTRGMFAGAGQGGNTARLEALVESLTAEVSSLRAETRAIVVSSADGAKQLKRWDGEGVPVRVAPGETFAVETTAAV